MFCGRHPGGHRCIAAAATAAAAAAVSYHLSATGFPLRDDCTLLPEHAADPASSHPSAADAAIAVADPILCPVPDHGAGLQHGVPAVGRYDTRPAPSNGAVVLPIGSVPSDGIFYGGVDGPLLYGGSPLPGHFVASPSAGSATALAAYGAEQGNHPPRFYKLEFTAYNGAEDPLN